ncbi:hypothetical protein EJ08DRAFT_512489 [Tothia fuscella]|uniref:Uncharacterized protein n=1 Tax=Tothia fuscella TaxID=1048955 RepID=A0A9P4NZ55_9PEZI|nr:hypothetical protein EJ08DRAFT_512489 [Tothia fuscella]
MTRFMPLIYFSWSCWITFGRRHFSIFFRNEMCRFMAQKAGKHSLLTRCRLCQFGTLCGFVSRLRLCWNGSVFLDSCAMLRATKHQK